MLRFISFFILLLLLFGCNTNRKITRILDLDLNKEKLDVAVLFNGRPIERENIDVRLVSVVSNRSTVKLDTFYDFTYHKYLFRVQYKYLEAHNGKSFISYDNRVIGNASKKEMRNEKLSFVRKYFILDTGLDDIYLIPIMKERSPVLLDDLSRRKKAG